LDRWSLLDTQDFFQGRFKGLSAVIFYWRPRPFFFIPRVPLGLDPLARTLHTFPRPGVRKSLSNARHSPNPPPTGSERMKPPSETNVDSPFFNFLFLSPLATFKVFPPNWELDSLIPVSGTWPFSLFTKTFFAHFLHNREDS